MKIIENFAELLHSEKLPEDFRDWFIWEENDSEKECKFFYSWFTPHFVRDTFFQLKTQFKFYRNVCCCCPEYVLLPILFGGPR